MKKLVVWALAGCLLFVFGFLSGSFWATTRFFNTFSEGAYSAKNREPVISSHDIESHFYEHVFWGGRFKPMEELQPPPKGPAKLQVRFQYENAPASGIAFSLALNEKYGTGVLNSDADGIAEVLLPFGTWQLNRLECKAWSNQPQGQFLLVSGEEAKLGARPFNELFFAYTDQGKIIHLDEKAQSPYLLPIEIRKRMKVIWPLPNERGQKATVAESAIQWEPYPNAASYVVLINQVTRDTPRTTTFSPLIYKQIDGTNSLPLEALPTVESSVAPREYAINIRAYHEDGSFLSGSERSFSTFSLTDNHILVKFDGSEDETFAQTDIESRFTAGEVLDAVVLMIDNSMFAEAQKLLAQSDTSYLPARTALLEGYLHAAQGACEKARQNFENALSLGMKCIPEQYRAGCSGHDEKLKQ